MKNDWIKKMVEEDIKNRKKVPTMAEMVVATSEEDFIKLTEKYEKLNKKI